MSPRPKGHTKKTVRKLIQITSVAQTIAALANDGTVWLARDMSWVRLHDLPADAEPKVIEDKNGIAANHSDQANRNAE